MKLHLSDVEIPEPAMTVHVTRWLITAEGFELCAEIEANDDGTAFTVRLTDGLVNGRAREFFKDLGSLEDATTVATDQLRRRWLFEKIDQEIRAQVDQQAAALR